MNYVAVEGFEIEVNDGSASPGTFTITTDPTEKLLSDGKKAYLKGTKISLSGWTEGVNYNGRTEDNKDLVFNESVSKKLYVDGKEVLIETSIARGTGKITTPVEQDITWNIVVKISKANQKLLETE